MKDLLNPNLDALDDEHRDHATLESLTSRRPRQAQKNASVLHSAADTVSSENASTTTIDGDYDRTMSAGSPAELEEEAAGEGAFNPETGEINWDCPCLGGMAHGPCGPEFREAFSCFVFSNEDPKGMDCIDRFQNMQQCFQKYPEVYKGELEDDEEMNAGLEQERQELVNEIAERKKEDQQPGTQKRLLEEADRAPRPTRGSNEAPSLQEHQSQRQSQSQAVDDSHQSEARSQQPQSLPRSSVDATGYNQQDNSKQPLEEGRIKVSDNPTHESTMSPDRENITEGQKSGVMSTHKKSSPTSDDETLVPQPEIVPKAAHDASTSQTEK